MPPTRVPGSDAEELIGRAEAAFAAGDPAAAFAATARLVETLREVVSEAARLRFEVNIGTPVCERCEGLKAGPGVIATCFQIRQCHYGNVREDGLSARQRRLLQVFSERGPTDNEPPMSNSGR